MTDDNRFALGTNRHKKCDGGDDNIEAEEGANSCSEHSELGAELQRLS